MMKEGGARKCLGGGVVVFDNPSSCQCAHKNSREARGVKSSRKFLRNWEISWEAWEVSWRISIRNPRSYTVVIVYCCEVSLASPIYVTVAEWLRRRVKAAVRKSAGSSPVSDIFLFFEVYDARRCFSDTRQCFSDARGRTQSHGWYLIFFG